MEPSKSKTPQSNSPDQKSHHTFLPNRVEAPSVPSATSSQDISIASKIAAARLTSTEEPEGTIVHAVAVSEACFKIGRMTVPPALVCALNGLSAPPSDLGSSLTQYSKANPPPHWTKVQAIASASRGGGMNKLAEFLVQGWRDMPGNERWWDSAFTGTVEQKRKAHLQVVESLRSRMEETAALI